MSGSSKKPRLPGVPDATYRAWEGELRDEYPSPEAWRRLLLRLRFGKAAFTDDNGDSRMPVGMDGVMHTISEITAFLHAHEIIQRQQLSEPLSRLANALVDIGQGRTPELLTPISVGMGGRAGPVAEHNLQAIAARALQELILDSGSRPGMKDAAAQTVAAAVRHGRIPGHTKCTTKIVAGWLDRIRRAESGKVKVPPALLARWNAPLPANVGITHRERADFLLDALRQGRGLRWR